LPYQVTARLIDRLRCDLAGQGMIEAIATRFDKHIETLVYCLVAAG
jgi:hypothetical protein